jgi:hypothetical protein
MVENLRVAYQLTKQPPDNAGSYTPNSASDPIALPPNLTYGDGVPLDVAHDVDLCRLMNNLIDYKCPASSPLLLSTSTSGSNAVGSSDMMLVLAVRINLTQELFTGGQYRKLDVSAWFRSDGTRAGVDETVRVTVAQNQPTGDSMANVNRGTVYAETSWTTQSTTWQTSAVRSLTLLNVKGGWFTSGYVWILVECSKGCETRGLARCQESRRFP